VLLRLVVQAAALLVAMPHAFCYVDLSKDLGSGGRKRRRKALYVQPEDAALHAANVSSRTPSELIPPRLYCHMLLFVVSVPQVSGAACCSVHCCWVQQSA
jgi:hypothetical protein